MAASLGKVLVIGATGQTGSKMICELLDADQPRASKVVAYGNTRMPAYGGRNAALFTAMQAPMEKLAGERGEELHGFDAIFIHVGTQRRKAGLDGQIKLEYDDTLAVAKHARQGGCRDCHIVSSMGASSNGSFTYMKTKGRIEEALRTVGFERLVIYRPAMLYGGDRDTFFKRVLFNVVGSGKIDVAQVARAMRVVALRPPSQPVEVLENKELLLLAKG
eukprot:CAMPEP_0180164710 /NCGR_PEP_ID=MMETSP0986-20121125/30541_1 /TAXON_ID=697907 /ORGANISM="non described non described, Strain CCMP2293" /LENGTH=218 /DNA_ID=CAMNT_0022115557 /DNA_START=10 /DNA_END=666 /DNA_ORIENTATION=-